MVSNSKMKAELIDIFYLINSSIKVFEFLFKARKRYGKELKTLKIKILRC
jgi:hypothetical protein